MQYSLLKREVHHDINKKNNQGTKNYCRVNPKPCNRILQEVSLFLKEFD